MIHRRSLLIAFMATGFVTSGLNAAYNSNPDVTYGKVQINKRFLTETLKMKVKIHLLHTQPSSISRNPTWQRIFRGRDAECMRWCKYRYMPNNLKKNRIREIITSRIDNIIRICRHNSTFNCMIECIFTKVQLLKDFVIVKLLTFPVPRVQHTGLQALERYTVLCSWICTQNGTILEYPLDLLISNHNTVKSWHR